MSDAPREPLLIDHVDERLTLTLNRPDAANALSPELVDGLLDVFDDPTDVRVCVIKGNGKNFCGGFDLSDLPNLSDADLMWRFLRIEALLQAVYHAPFPTIALAQGNVIGAGADVFAACSRRIAAPDSAFRMPGWNFELALGTRRLADIIGTDAARTMLIGTPRIGVEQAAEFGLVSAIVDESGWPEEVVAFQTAAADLSPTAVRSILDLTAHEHRFADMAALVASACRPGLRDRILAYGDRVAEQRAARRASTPK